MIKNNIGGITRLAGCLLLAAAPLAVRADLTYEVVNGTPLIYDSSDNTTWTQNGNISESTFTFTQAQTWVASLGSSLPGVSQDGWTLPTAAEFTSLYSQLEAPATINGQPNLPTPTYAGSKYGPQIFFGAGVNDYAVNIEGTYWTDASEVDFNFYYGDPGGGYPGGYFDNDSPLSAWAIEAAPEPCAGLMGLLTFGVLGGGLYLRRRPVRA